MRKGDIPLFIAIIELRLAEAAEASKLRSVLSANSKNAGRQGAKVKENQTEDKTEDGKPHSYSMNIQSFLFIKSLEYTPKALRIVDDVP